MVNKNARRWLAGCILTLACAAGAEAQTPEPKPAHQLPAISVYKDPNCGCCKNWIEHLRNHGFEVISKDVTELQAVKEANNVPAELQSCHTALVEGYVIEGHVPADIIHQLLKERPDIVGLAVPGMPVGSPGMEMQGREPQAYDVRAFARDGKISVYAKMNN